MTFEDLWRVEEALWLGGPQDYAAVLHPACLMAFAGVGVLDKDAAIEAVQGPRWRSVSAQGGVLGHVRDDLVVAAYRAEAARDAGSPYRCVCTSTYLRVGDAWRLIQHQQSAET